MSQEQAKQFIEQATQSVQSGQFPQALDLLDQAIALDPNNTEAFVLRGICLAQTGQPDAATESFRKAIMLSPYNAKAYFNLAVHQYALGRKVEALEMAREALKIEPTHSNARQLITQLEGEMSANVSPVRTNNPNDPLSSMPPVAGPTPTAPPAGAPMNQPPMAGPQEIPSQGPLQPPTMGTPPATPQSPYQAPTGSPYAQQSQFRPAYEQPAHSLPFVENMGGAWTAIGWILAALNLVPIVLIVILTMQAMQLGPGNQEAIQQYAQSSPLGVLFNISFWGGLILSILYTIFDLIDRRGNFVWLVPIVICGCGCSNWLVLPIYMLAGRNK